ncbi:MAG: homoserine O-succinyltransferase [Alphaproteobacteria bacterium]
MSIILPPRLPAAALLREEGIAVDEGGPGGEALRLLLVNLMPDKTTTETQFGRLLGASRHHVSVALTVPPGAVRREAVATHVSAFYTPWQEALSAPFHGVIVTGAPVERLAFQDVRYWRELAGLFDLAAARGIPAFYVCWAAQASLWHAHRVPKRLLPEKASGVYPQVIRDFEAHILRGIGSMLRTPVSRHTTARSADIPGDRGVRVLADSPTTGLCLAHDRRRRAYCMLNHLEYDAGTLAREYARDRAAGLAVPMPRGYFPGDDPSAPPIADWRPVAVRIFRNWLDEVAAARQPSSALISASMKAMSAGRRKDAAM